MTKPLEECFWERSAANKMDIRCVLWLFSPGR